MGTPCGGDISILIGGRAERQQFCDEDGFAGRAGVVDSCGARELTAVSAVGYWLLAVD
ncbi:MAG: hypothetical protein IT424_03385 [Pirellulales bacterium]|nr:hypothetical protein [Pirellulales bacterium]